MRDRHFSPYASRTEAAIELLAVAFLFVSAIVVVNAGLIADALRSVGP